MYICMYVCVYNIWKDDGGMLPKTLEHVGKYVSAGTIWVYNIIDLNMGISAPSNAPEPPK